MTGATWTAAVGEALLNGWWQGILVWAFAALSVRMIPPVMAGVRHIIWYVALVAIAVLPLLHFVGASARPHGRGPEAVDLGAPPSPPAPATVRIVEKETVAGAPQAGWEGARSLPRVAVPAGPFAAGWVLLWLGVAAVLLGRVLVAVRGVFLLKQRSGPPPEQLRGWCRRWATESPCPRRAELRVSSRIGVPLTAGLWRPAVLFPEPLVPHLSETEALAVWLHELAHIERLDDWARLGQRIAEALAWFHPAMRWISRRLELEREIACDARVARRTGGVKAYAACLARIAALSAGARGPSLAPAMALEQKQIFRRIDMLMKNNRSTTGKPAVAGVLGVAGLVTLTIALAVSGPLVVLAQEAAPPAPPALPAPEVEASEAPPAPPAPPASPRAPERVPGAVRPTAPPAPPRLPQAQVPPVPAAPEAAPQPAPTPSPGQDDRRAQAEAIRVEVEKHQKELRELSRQISQEVESNIRPHTEEIRKLAGEIHVEIERHIRPAAEEIARLGAEIGRRYQLEKPDPETIKKLEEQMRGLEKGAMRQAEERIRELEAKIRERESSFRPSEETIRKIEEKMKDVERRLEEKLKEVEARRAPI